MCRFATTLQRYDVPPPVACVLAWSAYEADRDCIYNVDAAIKHARQEGLGQVHQVSGVESRSDNSAVEIGPEGQYYVQTGFLSWWLGKSKLCSSLDIFIWLDSARRVPPDDDSFSLSRARQRSNFKCVRCSCASLHSLHSGWNKIHTGIWLLIKNKRK